MACVPLGGGTDTDLAQYNVKKRLDGYMKVRRFFLKGGEGGEERPSKKRILFSFLFSFLVIIYICKSSSTENNTQNFLFLFLFNLFIN